MRVVPVEVFGKFDNTRSMRRLSPRELYDLIFKVTIH